MWWVVCATLYVALTEWRKASCNRRRSPGRVIHHWTTLVPAGVRLGSLVVFLSEAIRRHSPLYWPVTLGGCILLLFVTLGKEWTYRSLGDSWSRRIEVRPHHPIVQAGPYRYVRHPNFSFNLLEVLAFSLILNAWIAGLVILIAWLLYSVRIDIEEQALIKEVGAAYEEYRGRVPRLCPRLWNSNSSGQGRSTSQ